MRKFTWVLLGLVVLLAAVGFATNKHYLEPQKSRVVTSSSQQAPGAPSAGQKRSVTPSVATPSGWQSFDTIINVLNVVVGILGIWMTLHGMRMQRQAINLQAQNRR